MNDWIDRQVAIDAMHRLVDGGACDDEFKENPHIDAIVETLENLPSAQTKENEVFQVLLDPDFAEDLKKDLREIVKKYQKTGKLEIQPEQPESAEDYCAECNHIEMCRWYPYEGCEFRDLPKEQPEQTTIKKLYDILVDLCENIRERYGQDDICGLCQYDADHGLDGHANECPGFEREDCFCMKNEIRRMCGVEIVPEPW